MCSAISTTPLLAKRCEPVLSSDADSDVTFLVGPEMCRVPGHRSVLAAANPVFRRMFEGPIGCEHSVTVPDVKWRGFANLLRYLYQEPVQLQSVQTVLATLYAAHKYQCHGLELLCIDHLAASLNLACVLDVYSDIRNYCESLGCTLPADEAEESESWAPSAPPLPGDSEYCGLAPAELRALVAGYAGLRRRCLAFCDERADEVLGLEQLEELSRAELLELVSRDAFCARSEAAVFGALLRWARCRCLVARRPLRPAELRDELGPELLYAARYPRMSVDEFLAGPMRSDLLPRDDAVFFLELIARPASLLAAPTPTPKHLEEALPRLCAERTPPPGVVVRPGGRAAAASVASSCLRGKKTASKKERKAKAKDGDATATQSEGFSFYLLSCLSCILD